MHNAIDCVGSIKSYLKPFVPGVLWGYCMVVMPLIPLMVCVLYFRSEYYLRDTQLSGACEYVKFFLSFLSAYRFYITGSLLER